MNDQEVMDLLRDLHTPGGPARTDALELLAVARSGHRRVTALKLGGIAVTVAGCAVAVGMLVGGHPASNEVEMAPVTSPSAGPTSGPVSDRGGTSISPDASADDGTILREDLGTDFVYDTRTGPDGFPAPAPGATLQEATATAAGLPDGYTVTVRFMDMGNGDFALGDLCHGPALEKGLATDACVSRTLPDGRTVTEQWSRWPVGTKQKGSAEGQQLRLMYLRPDHELVVLDVLVGQNQHPATAVTRAAVRSWIEKFEPRASTVATDPRLRADLNDGDE